MTNAQKLALENFSNPTRKKILYLVSKGMEIFKITELEVTLLSGWERATVDRYGKVTWDRTDYD